MVALFEIAEEMVEFPTEESVEVSCAELDEALEARCTCW